MKGNSGGLAVDENGIFVGVPSAVFSNYEDQQIGVIIAGKRVQEWFYASKKIIEGLLFSPPEIVTAQPGIITTLKVKKLSPTSVQLDWEEPVSSTPIDRYALTRDTKDVFSEDYDSIKKFPNYTETSNNKISSVVSELDPKKTYYFSVVAIDENDHFGSAWFYPGISIDLASGEVGRFFSDVSLKHPHLQAIGFLKDTYTISGYPDGTFRSQNTIQRAELMKIVTLGKDIYVKPEDYNNCFADVKDEWFAPYVCYAKEQGWVKGYTDNTFKPGQEVNFAEAMKIIQEIYEMPLDKVNTTVKLPDSFQNQWFTPYFNLAAEFRILPENFTPVIPSDKISRADAAEYLYRTMLLYEYRNQYSPEKWRDSDNNVIDVPAFSGIVDGVTYSKEFKMDEKITPSEETITKKCVLSKAKDCFLVKDEDDTTVEIQLDQNSLSVLSENMKALKKPILYSEPYSFLSDYNRVQYFRAIAPFEVKEEIGTISFYDGIQYFQHLGNEVLQTRHFGKQDVMKIKIFRRMRGRIFFEGQERAIYLETEGIQYLAKDLGPVKQELTITMKTQANDVILTIQSVQELTQRKKAQ